jgi:hypothetical protein
MHPKPPATLGRLTGPATPGDFAGSGGYAEEIGISEYPSFSRKGGLMRNTLYENPRVKRRQPGAAVLFWTTVATLAVLLWSGSAGVVQAQVIQWKFKTGDVLRYALEHKTVVTAKKMGRETKSTRSDTQNLSWTVTNVSSIGEADIIHRIERVRLRIEAPPYVPFEFDSDAPKVDAPEPFDVIAHQTKAMVGVEYAFKIKPNGEISDIVIPAQTIKSLRDAEKPPEGAGAGESTLSEQGIKEMLMQSSPPAFPVGQLESGKTWSSKPAKIPTPLGNVVMDKIFTFQGADSKNPNLLLVDMETRVALEPLPNSPVTAKIRTHESKGSLTFHADAGRIVRMRGTEKTEMLISAMGQEIDQTTDSTTSMTLQ